MHMWQVGETSSFHLFRTSIGAMAHGETWRDGSAFGGPSGRNDVPMGGARDEQKVLLYNGGAPQLGDWMRPDGITTKVPHQLVS